MHFTIEPTVPSIRMTSISSSAISAVVGRPGSCVVADTTVVFVVSTNAEVGAAAGSLVVTSSVAVVGSAPGARPHRTTSLPVAATPAVPCEMQAIPSERAQVSTRYGLREDFRRRHH